MFVSIGFTSKGKTPEAALKADADTSSKVSQAMIAAGVESRDLQTKNYVIIEDQGPDGCGQHYDNTNFVPCTLQGYDIQNSMTVRIRDLDHYGQILEAAIHAGLTDISNITLDVADRKPFEDQAYAAALLAAKAKAELTAKTLGFKLGAIVDIGANFRDAYTQPQPATLADGIAINYGEENADLGMLIQPGEITFTRDASITYQIVQEH